MTKIEHNIGFQEKRHFFAENSDRNNDPWKSAEKLGLRMQLGNTGGSQSPQAEQTPVRVSVSFWMSPKLTAGFGNSW
jgi:hypothetical protein